MVKDVTPHPSLSDDNQSMQALRQYGSYIVLAIITALAGYFGWSYWQNHGGRIDQAAATDFAKLQSDQTNIANLMDVNTSEAKQQLAATQANFGKDLDNFISQHGNSVYTWQALMLKAKQQSESNDPKNAIATLQKATQLKLKDEGLAALSTLRYAQALLANNQADEAQKALQPTLPPAFDASKNELLGDIALHKNDKKTAVEHYQKAWQAIETRNKASSTQQDRALLRLKMENLGLSPKQPDLSDGIISKPTMANHTDVASEVSANASSIRTASASSAQ